MKKSIVLILALLLLAACQPTPDHDAVKQKDTNVLIEAVLSAQAEATEAPVPMKSQVLERYMADFYTPATNVHVQVDAPIRVRSEGGFPLVRVERRAVTDEERLTLCLRLFHADTLYRFELRESREDLVNRIAALMQERTPEEKAAWLREDPENTEEAWEAIQPARKAELSELEARYRAMEDGEPVPLKVWDGALLPDDAENPGQEIVVDPNATNDIWRMDHAYFYAPRHDEPIDFVAANGDELANGLYNAVFFDKSNGEQEAYRIDPAAYSIPVEGAHISPRIRCWSS